jgi:hypothetical protein
MVFLRDGEVGIFAGGFAKSVVQNVVICVVKRGGIVVKAW